MKTKMQRITISLPDYLYQRLKKRVPARQVSRFVVEAVETKLPFVTATEKEDPIDAFLAMGEHFPVMTDKELKKAIRRGLT